jgi:hypothetical protein
MLASQGIEIDRATLALWVGYAAAELAPLAERLRTILLGSAKITVDETRAPVLEVWAGPIPLLENILHFGLKSYILAMILSHFRRSSQPSS